MRVKKKGVIKDNILILDQATGRTEGPSLEIRNNIIIGPSLFTQLSLILPSLAFR